MATRSAIGIVKGNSVRSIYCHNDGYVEGVGFILNRSYKDVNKVDKLINLGSISRLGNKLESEGEHTFSNPEYDVTVAYGRDRGETGVGYRELKTNKTMTLKQVMQGVGGQHFGTEYIYLYFPQNNKWVVFYYDENGSAKLLDLGTGEPIEEKERKVKITREESVNFARKMRQNKNTPFKIITKGGRVYLVVNDREPENKGFTKLDNVSWGLVQKTLNRENLTQGQVANYLYLKYNNN